MPKTVDKYSRDNIAFKIEGYISHSENTTILEEFNAAKEELIAHQEKELAILKAFTLEEFKKSPVIGPTSRNKLIQCYMEQEENHG